MVVNPVGAVPIFDGGVPRIITARNAVGVTGGQLVYFSGATGAVSSGADTFISSDINVIAVASGTAFNGIVITPGNTASGTNSYVGIGTFGTYIIPADGTVTAGEAVMCAGTDAVQDCGSLGGTALRLGTKIGRALTAAASGTANYAVISLSAF